MAHSFSENVVGFKDDYRRTSEQFMLEDLARSGLAAEDMGCRADVVYPNVKKELLRLVESSYLIPYYGLDGLGVNSMWRRRIKWSAGAKVLKVGKYTQPVSVDTGNMVGLPYIPPRIWKMRADGVLHICEGEKKAVALAKFGGVRAIGIGGKDNTGPDTIKWIRSVIVQLGDVRRVCIWPDADVRRWDVRKSYGKFKSRLVSALYDIDDLAVDIMSTSWDTRRWNAIDDALAGGWELREEVLGEELPLDMRALADEIGLAYSTGAKGDRFELEINEHNVIKILSVERLWGEFSLNKDNGKWMLGGVDLDPNLHVVEFLSRLQSIFGLGKVKYELVWRCIDHMCRRGSRSAWADWLEGLTWDGKPRLGGWLTRYCGAQAGDGFIEEAGTKFLVSVVARTMRPGCKVDWMLIMSGPQGCGKSSVAEWLMPEQFRRLALLAPSGQDKDLHAAMSMGRILCFDEMAIFFKKADEREFIKGFVSTTVDVCRPPYGRVVEAIERGSVLFGNTNRREDILKEDSSGYRRWVIVEVCGVVSCGDGVAPQFDWTGLDEVREQLWAEAVALWRGGLDVSQVRGASERAARDHVVDDPAEFDYFITVLKSMRLAEKFSMSAAGMRVKTSEFALAYRDMFGREPFQPVLTSFWKRWECEAKKSNGERVRQLSDALWNVINSQ